MVNSITQEVPTAIPTQILLPTGRLAGLDNMMTPQEGQEMSCLITGFLSISNTHNTSINRLMTTLSPH